MVKCKVIAQHYYGIQVVSFNGLFRGISIFKQVILTHLICLIFMMPALLASVSQLKRNRHQIEKTHSRLLSGAPVMHSPYHPKIVSLNYNNSLAICAIANHGLMHAEMGGCRFPPSVLRRTLTLSSSSKRCGLLVSCDSEEARDSLCPPWLVAVPCVIGESCLMDGNWPLRGGGGHMPSNSRPFINSLVHKQRMQ